MLNDRSDQMNLSVKSSGDTRVIRMDDRRSLADHEERMLNMKAALILQSAVLPKDASPEDRKNLAMAGAIMSHYYDIDVIADEAYFIPKDGGGYKISAGYRAMVKSRLRVQERTGKSWVNDNKVMFLSPEEIERLGLHICRKCNGNGFRQYGNKKYDCDKCNKLGKYDPADCLFAEVKMYCVEDALACKEIGIEYTPMIGTALWQPCDNVPKNRDAKWVVTKNAWNDVYRKVFPITIMGKDNFKASNLSQDVEDKSTEQIAELCGQYGVEFDDLSSLADFVRKCVYVADWASEEEVIRGMSQLGISWRIDEEDVNKYKLFGWRLGEYPLGDHVFETEDPTNGILVKNIIGDLGGIDSANIVSQELFGKNISTAMSREELGKIYERGSIIDAGEVQSQDQK